MERNRWGTWRGRVIMTGVGGGSGEGCMIDMILGKRGYSDTRGG